MTTSLIRGRHMITRTLDRHRRQHLVDAAILQQDGIIAAIGPPGHVARLNERRSSNNFSTTCRGAHDERDTNHVADAVRQPCRTR
ncbi:MAG: hypothetical protein ACREF3_14785 [Acetobacteraceae bacterium]